MELSLSQKALIPIFIEKWLKLAFSTKNIDREQKKETIIAAYKFLGYSEPEIMFFESTESVAQNIKSLLEAKIAGLKNKQSGQPVLKRIGNKLENLFPIFFEVCTGSFMMKLL